MINTVMTNNVSPKNVVSPKNGEKAMYRATDHLIIKDKTTGKVVLNKRG